MEKILQGQIEALVPIYTGTGANASIVRRVEGDLLLDKSIKSVLRDICRYYHYDLASSNKKYGEILAMKKMPPIPFREDLILIAVKTRLPIGKDDGAFSYVNIDQVERVEGKIIYFKDGNSLKILAEDRTVEKNIRLAELLKSQLRKSSIMAREVEAIYDISLGERLDIKRDLSLIYEKIQGLEKLFLSLKD